VRKRLILAGTFLLITALALTACGGDDDDDVGSSPTRAATQTGSAVSATATQSGGGGGATFVEIDAADFSFSPDDVTAAAGVDLDFVISNTGAATHTFDLYSDADYTQPVEGGSTGNIPSGTVGEFVIPLEAGEFFFRCEIHPAQMEGTLTAE
jgi:plastocyanin